MTSVQFKAFPAGKANQATNPLSETRDVLLEAEKLRLQRKNDQALALCERLVSRYPDYVGALHTLGLIHADKGDLSRALSCLVRAVMLNSKDWKTLTALSGVYLQLGASNMAAQTLEQARLLKPEDVAIAHTLGEIYREEREYELAKEAFATALALDPSVSAAAMGFGWSCIHLGQLTEAAAVFEGLVNRGAYSVKTLLALSQLPASLVSVDLFSLLDQVATTKNQDEEKLDHWIASTRAAAFDKAGKHVEAWESLVAANRRPFLQTREAYGKACRWQEAALAHVRGSRLETNSNRAGTGEHALSLFIIGPSRSGKTTMERLVSGLGGVKRGYENPIVENSVRRAFQSEGLLTRSRFAELPLNLDTLCRENYLDELAGRARGAKVFTNTHPERIYDVARMVSAYPNVRIIFMKRDPSDIALRIYMKQYGGGNYHAYDLGNVRDYVSWYYQMIDVLAARLPDISRIIRYEDMIADPFTALQTAAGLCGLAMPQGLLPELGDDRGCAEPYRVHMAGALNK